MAWIIVALISAAAAVYAVIRMEHMKRDIYHFTEKLERSLDEMVSGKAPEESGPLGDSLWGKVSSKLQKIYRIQNGKQAEAVEERRQIKELISDISHQTKTPIANMKLCLEMLEGTKPDEEEKELFLKRMGGQVKKLDFLLQSMVKMSRLETGVIEIHQKDAKIYDTLAQAVAAVVPPAEKKKIAVYVECDEDLIISHDRRWTEEAVFNILDNAVKYTGEGGSIHITVAVQELFTKISIKDSGKGIARERQAEIFGRFYREPEVHDVDGIGVGLYLARKIITLQNGYIEVRSQPGEGAEFRIYLPNREV